MRNYSSEKEEGHAEVTDKAASDANGAQRAIQVLLDDLRHGCAPVDGSPPAPIDNALNLLRDHAGLLKAQENLQAKGRDKTLDVIFQGRISAMINILYLFLDPGLLYI